MISELKMCSPVAVVSGGLHHVHTLYYLVRIGFAACSNLTFTFPFPIAIVSYNIPGTSSVVVPPVMVPSTAAPPTGISSVTSQPSGISLPPPGMLTQMPPGGVRTHLSFQYYLHINSMKS